MGDGTRILAQGCRINNDTWKTGLNNNDLIIGPSGSGKTRSYVLPNILLGNESMVIADTKGNLKRQTEDVLKRKGFQIIQIDFTDCLYSYGYNPFDFIRYDSSRDCYVEQDILTMAACIVPVKGYSDPYWELAARFYLESFIAYILECLPEQEHSLDFAVRLLAEMGTGRFEKLMEELQEIHPGSFALSRYNLYKNNVRAEKMHESIRGILAEKLSVFSFDGAKAMFHQKKRIDFNRLGREKVAVFLTVSDTDRSMDRLADLFFTQAVHTLCQSADRDYEDSRLAVPVRFLLDDFAAGIFIPDFDKIISVIRSREISVSIILQSISQLESMYGHARAMTIINNCDNCLYLGGQDVETARYISTRADKWINTVLEMPLDEAWLFTRGSKPRQVRKYQMESCGENASLFVEASA